MGCDMKLFRVEYLDLTGKEPEWFNSVEHLNRFLALVEGCQINDGPARLRISTFELTHVELRTLQ